MADRQTEDSRSLTLVGALPHSRAVTWARTVSP